MRGWLNRRICIWHRSQDVFAGTWGKEGSLVKQYCCLFDCTILGFFLEHDPVMVARMNRCCIENGRTMDWLRPNFLVGDTENLCVHFFKDISQKWQETSPFGNKNEEKCEKLCQISLFSCIFGKKVVSLQRICVQCNKHRIAFRVQCNKQKSTKCVLWKNHDWYISVSYKIQVQWRI